MAITFPLSLPVEKYARVEFSANNVTSVTQSPFSLSVQTQEYSGKEWQAEITYSNLTRADAEEVKAFLLSLQGYKGTFLLGDPYGATPRGTASGTPLVNGALAIGDVEVVSDGWSVSQTVLKKGDYIQLPTNKLYCVLNDVTSDVAGNATIDIWPAIKSIVSDNQSITTSNCKTTFRLASNQTPLFSASGPISNPIYSISFSAIEAN